jgi:hypothetical protein
MRNQLSITVVVSRSGVQHLPQQPVVPPTLSPVKEL